MNLQDAVVSVKYAHEITTEVTMGGKAIGGSRLALLEYMCCHAGTRSLTS